MMRLAKARVNIYGDSGSSSLLPPDPGKLKRRDEDVGRKIVCGKALFIITYCSVTLCLVGDGIYDTANLCGGYKYCYCFNLWREICSVGIN